MSAVQGGVFLALIVSVSATYNYLEDLGNVFAPNASVSEDTYTLPTGFLFGAASAAYQIEGAWNASGKGPSIWDDFLHTQPDLDNGDVADDSYHHYKEDVTLVKNTLFNVYRFSMSWSRLLPDGTNSSINQNGVDYYNSLIDDLIDNGITPVVTLYHFDLPSALEAKGGWVGGPEIQDYFLEYARFVFRTFGDKVQWWVTFNEPLTFCQHSLASSGQVGYSEPGVGIYQCSYNVVLAHAKAYKAYYDEFSLQGGQVGMTNALENAQPLRPDNTDDQDAANRYLEFAYAWFVDPIVFGDYPKSMRETIDTNSKAEGRTLSRLPVFTDEENTLLKDSTDFLGTNHYATMTATPSASDSSSNVPSYSQDMAVTTSAEPSWQLGTFNSKKTPWGLRRIVNWIKDRYHNLPILITENGYNGNVEEHTNDFNRISYYSTFMRALLKAVRHDNCNVIGYIAWSLLDNLEWVNGYKMRFGLHFVDFTDPSRKRTPKKSVQFFRGVARTKKVQYYGFVNE